MDNKLKLLYEAIRDFREPKANRQLALIFMKLPSKNVSPARSSTSFARNRNSSQQFNTTPGAIVLTRVIFSVPILRPDPRAFIRTDSGTE